MEYIHPTKRERKEERKSENIKIKEVFYKPYLEDAKRRRRGEL